MQCNFNTNTFTSCQNLINGAVCSNARQNPNAYSCAHKRYPKQHVLFYTYMRVETGKTKGKPCT